MGLIAFVFARGGSKGIPSKNLSVVAGKSLIARAVEIAFTVSQIERVIVSTDSREIALEATRVGAEVPFMRPSELSEDSSPEWLAWRHAVTQLAELEGEMPPVLVSVPTTSPLRIASDVEACLVKFQEGVWDAVITVTPSHRNPYFNMVTLDSTGAAQVVISPSHSVSRRQDSPPVFDMCTSAYVVSTEFLMSHDNIWQGKVGAVFIPQDRSLDIDTPFDLKVARLLTGNWPDP